MKKNYNNTRNIYMRSVLLPMLLLTVLLTAGCENDSGTNAPESLTEEKEDKLFEETVTYDISNKEQMLPYETTDETSDKKSYGTTEEQTMIMKIAGQEVKVRWEENASVEELKTLSKDGLTIRMSMYGGFEQVGPIGHNITRNDEQTTTEAGDVVLYAGNQLVVFYGSNSWAYTRLGKIDLSEKELKKLLGNGDTVISLEYEEE